MTKHDAERYALVAAGIVIVALTAGAFWLSYAHLADVAGQHGLGAFTGPPLGVARHPGRVHRRGRTAHAPRGPAPGHRPMGHRRDRHRIGRLHRAERCRGQRHG